MENAETTVKPINKPIREWANWRTWT